MADKNRKERDIRSFKPQRNARTHQGYFLPKFPEKYKGDTGNIIYRSGWEHKFLKFCDDNDKIIEYASEPFGIPYWNPIKKKTATYWVDAWIKIKDSKGELKEWLLEIKPLKYTKPPTAPKRLTESQLHQYALHAKAYIINRAKFDAAIDYAHSKNINFGVITENFLFD